jgi:hypothetical protein
MGYGRFKQKILTCLFLPYAMSPAALSHSMSPVGASTGARFFRRVEQYIPHVLKFEKRLSDSDWASLGQLDPRIDGHGRLVLARFDRRRSAAAPIPGRWRAGTATPLAAAGCANGGRAGCCGSLDD